MSLILEKSLLRISLALMLLMPFCALAQTPRQIAQTASASVVLLVFADSNGQPISQASGFFVRPGIVATNLHVLRGASSGIAKLVGQKQVENIASVLAVDTAHDLVLLGVPNQRAPALTLGDSEKIGVGDEVFVLGNPQGLEGTFSQGIISSLRVLSEDKLIQITAPISPGSSGGPVFNSRGEVIGVAAATFQGGQNLNFAIPSVYLKHLLSVPHDGRPISTVAKPLGSKSLLPGLGGKSSDGVIGSQFSWDKDSYDLYFSGDFSFSIRNLTQEAIEQVQYLIVFYDRSGKPIDAYEGNTYKKFVIRPGLARRETGRVEESVRRLCFRVEVRILDFAFSK
ncbi:MAG: serine protease [Acidobacteria bacterium]|nr:serine protease [Acidobacteriota bacterium]